VSDPLSALRASLAEQLAHLRGIPQEELPESLLDDSQLGALDALEPAPSGSAADAAPAELPRDLAVYLDEVERSILLRALEAHRFNRTAAGASLGLSLRQMRYRMARLNIGVGEG